METSYGSPPQVEEIKPVGFSPLFAKVQRIYIGQFRELFAITAPTSVVGAVLWVLADRKINAVYPGTPTWAQLTHSAEMVEILALRFGIYFFSWFLGCFALAAIATVVGRLDAEEEYAPLRDRHQRAREHLWGIFKTAIATFLALLVGWIIAGLVVEAIFSTFRHAHVSRFHHRILLIAMLLMTGVVSRLGMAVPLVVRGDTGVWASLKKSLKIGERHSGFLYVLLMQAIVGSYVGWYAVHFALMLAPESIKPSPWYGWVVLIVSALASAAVSPPLFIGFSLLAEEGTQPAAL